MGTNPETHTEGTMAKVYGAMIGHGLKPDEALDIINALQNAGILFREISEAGEDD